MKIAFNIKMIFVIWSYKWENLYYKYKNIIKNILKCGLPEGSKSISAQWSIKTQEQLQVQDYPSFEWLLERPVSYLVLDFMVGNFYLLS